MLLACAVVYWLTAGFDEPPGMLAQNIPPTFFPRLVLGIVAILSLLLVVAGLRKAHVTREPVRRSVFVTAAMIVAAGLLVGLLGTLATMLVFAIALPLSWGERRWPLVGAVAAALPVALYLIFSVGLDVRFPGGSLVGSLW